MASLLFLVISQQNSSQKVWKAKLQILDYKLAMIYLFWLFFSRLKLDFDGLKNVIDLLNSFRLINYQASHQLVSQECHG